MERNQTVKSPSDGLELDILEVLPDHGTVVGIVQIAHGMQEHKERYRDFMNYLASKGYAVVCADHRGHGKSIQCPEDLGYFYDESGDAIVEDLNAVQENLRQEYPGVPVFLIAHSMGTLVARKYIQSYDDRISALVLSGAVYKNPAAKPGKMLVNVIRAFKGDRYISKFVANLVEGSFDKGIAGEQKNRWLSYNEDNVDRFNADPICGKTFYFEWLCQFIAARHRLLSKKRLGIEKSTIANFLCRRSRRSGDWQCSTIYEDATVFKRSWISKRSRKIIRKDAS